MTSPPPIPMEDYLQGKVSHLLQLKGQIDMRVATLPEKDHRGNTDPWRATYEWLQGIITDLLDLADALQRAYKFNKESATQSNRLLRLILGVDEHAPKEELEQRARDLGEFYDELRRRRG